MVPKSALTLIRNTTSVFVNVREGTYTLITGSSRRIRFLLLFVFCKEKKKVNVLLDIVPDLEDSDLRCLSLKNYTSSVLKPLV